jgi:acetyl-CoA carboxylase biotin carboxyl carrier protein
VSDKPDVGDADALARLAAVIDAFERSDWDEIHLDTGDITIHLSTANDAGALAPPASAPRPAAAAAHKAVVAPSAESVAAEPAAGVPMVAGPVVVAPSPGIFWRRPSPTAAPFVEVGDEVAVETPLCIVEVMKLMTQVTAGQPGRIAQIRVANGDVVETGQVLFVLSPA